MRYLTLDDAFAAAFRILLGRTTTHISELKFAFSAGDGAYIRMIDKHNSHEIVIGGAACDSDEPFYTIGKVESTYMRGTTRVFPTFGQACDYVSNLWNGDSFTISEEGTKPEGANMSYILGFEVSELTYRIIFVRDNYYEVRITDE